MKTTDNQDDKHTQINKKYWYHPFNNILYYNASHEIDQQRLFR